MNEIVKVLKSAKKMPFGVKSEEDAITAATSMLNDRITPIFQVSNVSGEGLDELKIFLNLLTVRREWDASVSAPAEFNIDDSFRIPGVGTVVAGTVISGTISTNSTLLFGPDSLGKFKPVTVKSIHSKFTAVKSVCAGMPASFAIKSNLKRDTITKAQVRKGMVMLAPPEGGGDPVASCCFDAEVMILHHPTTMTVNYQPVVHW
jgi:GTPase